MGPSCWHVYQQSTSSWADAGCRVEQYLDYLDSLSQASSHSLHHASSKTLSTRASSSPRPTQDTDGSGTGTTHRTVVLEAPSGSKDQEGSEIDDECLPPHFVDIFAGRSRPMSRAMEWCGWTTSSFEKFPAECRCIWAECKCGHSKDVRSEACRSRSSTR